jgi:lipopolysaccharide export system protein LptA
MTTKSAQQKLKNAGYRVVFTTSGNVIATKGQRTYTAASITALLKQIF